MPSTLRFLAQYLRPDPTTTMEAEVPYTRASEQLTATLYRPAGVRRPLPGWVVLHGLTRTGRAHPSLVRFARAVASAGNIVFVPEIPEWRALRVAASVTVPTIGAAVRALQQRADVRHAHVGVFGFSFGATQALIASTDEATARQLAGIAAWGGYCDLHRVFRFGLTGLHDLDGVTYQTRPDPYGAWIMAGNYLPNVPGYEDAGPVAQALLALAVEAGDTGNYAWDPVLDASKRRLRSMLPADQQELFDMLAPATDARHSDERRLVQLSDELADTVLRLDPLMEASSFLPRVGVPALLAHGRDDRLIPFTETLRLARMVPAPRLRSVTVTSLFQHSGATQKSLGPVGLAWESARFLALLRNVLRLV